MTPERLKELSNIADPKMLWATAGVFDRHKLSKKQKDQVDTGVALRRYAEYLENLAIAKTANKSLLVTPLSSNSSAVKLVEIPASHKRLKTK